MIRRLSVSNCPYGKITMRMKGLKTMACGDLSLAAPHLYDTKSQRQNIILNIIVMVVVIMRPPI